VGAAARADETRASAASCEDPRRRNPAGARRGAARRARGDRPLPPDLVLACWVPPGPLLGRILRAPVREVLEIGAGSGITGDISCWRYEHEFCEDLEALGAAASTSGRRASSTRG